MAAKKFYAIAVGRRPGIYEKWPDAQAQVSGFAGARFKGFASRAEAEAWLADPKGGCGPVRPKAGQRLQPEAAECAARPGEVIVYTDGGARYNPGPGGYGVVELCDGRRLERSGGFRFTTNNRMELMACIVALRELSCRDRPVTLCSDSSYVVNGISKGWARSWRQNGWLKGDRQPAVNPDLWARLLDLTEELDVRFRWVRGHNGDPLNERCDELAVAASFQEGLPEDAGYVKSEKCGAARSEKLRVKSEE